MDKNYDHLSAEDKIYESWEKSGLMRADNQSTRKPFVVPLPPPNVTGQLHLGHSAMLAIEDIVVRYKRMTDHEVLWVPGTDHAAIATENVVIKHLGINRREEMTRENFLKECRKFAGEKHDRIVHQIRKMGAWLDWSREAYTFDEARNHGVNTIFKKLFEDGLIVRGHRMINWSTGAQSVLADDELEWDERTEPFFYIKCGSFIMGTVRAETKCADSPVIVNPDGTYVILKPKSKGDSLILSEKAWKENALFASLKKEYSVEKKVKGSELVGQKFEAETYAGTRKFWVIADHLIDMEKGTGIMTISAAHSEDDYELATRLNLKDLFFQKIDFSGKMTRLAGPCEGMPIEEARKKAAKIMQEKGLLVAEDKNYRHRVPLCYRSGCVVEPMVSEQWFVSVDKEFTDEWTGEKTTLKKLTQDAVREKHVKIIPERFEKIYFQWIDNLRDWCISRQIWWGHQIPVWYDEKKNIHLPREQKFVFARHGETDGNKNKIIQGQHDELNKKGIQDAEKLAEFLKSHGIKKIISSPSRRALTTTEVVAKKLKLPVEMWPEFAAMDFGELAGKPNVPGELAIETATRLGIGESKTMVFKRVQKGWEKLKKEKSDGAILVISHRNILSALDTIRAGKDENEWIKNRRKMDNAHFGFWGETSVMQAPEGKNLKQDEGTLDTWFSSALWPFSTLGWPDDKNADFQKFYPTDLLETGHDILFFWVARMIMFGRYATGKYPFHTVYLHGLVCDEKGQKMSKSKGNGIDPLDVISESGADAVRLSLVIGTAPGNPIPLGKGKVSGYRNFVNKLWNAGRFVQMQIPEGTIRESSLLQGAKSIADRWILSRFVQTAKEVAAHLEKYEISIAGDKIYHFVWDEFCDWYIEASKAEKNPEFLHGLFLEILKLVHPLCPFVTEKIWNELGQNADGKHFLIDQPFPAHAFKDKEAEELFEKIKSIVTEIRRVRAEKNLNPKEKISVSIAAGKQKSALAESSELIKVLANLGEVTVEEKIKRPENSVALVVDGTEVFVEIPFDAAAEKTRLEKEILELQKKIAALRGRLANKSYAEKAPAALVEQTKNELEKSVAELQRIEQELKNLK